MGTRMLYLDNMRIKAGCEIPDHEALHLRLCLGIEDQNLLGPIQKNIPR